MRIPHRRTFALGLALTVAAISLLVSTTGVRAATPLAQVTQFANGKCIDDTGWSRSQGTRLQLYSCLGNSNQHWYENITPCNYWAGDDEYCAMIQNAYSGFCLDVQGNSSRWGTPAIQWGCNPADKAQLFKIEPAPGTSGPPNWMLVASNGLCLDDPNQSSANGTKLQFYGCNLTVAQIWRASGWIGVWP